MADKIIKTQLHPQAPADTSDIIYPETSVDQVKGLPEPSVDNNNKVIIVTTEGYGTADYNKATKVRVGVTKTLPAGYSASVSNVGTPEEPILEFAIPQGIQGIQGKRGEQGAKGSSIESMNNNGYEVNGDYTQNDISATVINDSLPIDNPDHTLNYHYSVYAKNGDVGSPIYYYDKTTTGVDVTDLISELVPTSPKPKQWSIILSQNGNIMLVTSITDTEFTASFVSDLKVFIESAVNSDGWFSKSLMPLTDELRIGSSVHPLNSVYTDKLFIMSKATGDTHSLSPFSYEYNSKGDSKFKIEFLDANQVTTEKFGLDFRTTRQSSKSELSFGQYNQDNSFGYPINKLGIKYRRQYTVDGYKQGIGLFDDNSFIDFRYIPFYLNRMYIREISYAGTIWSVKIYFYSNDPIYLNSRDSIKTACVELLSKFGTNIINCYGYIREMGNDVLYPIDKIIIDYINDVHYFEIRYLYPTSGENDIDTNTITVPESDLIVTFDRDKLCGKKYD